MEHPEDIIYDRLLVLHGKHPDAELSGMILLPKLRTGKPQKRQTDLITVLLMVLLRQADCLV